MTQSHRDRVLMSINRKQPDRPPLDLGGPAWSIADTPPYGYRKFCEYLGFMDVSIAIRPGTRIVSSIDERILELFDVDLRWVRMGEPRREFPGDIIEDCYGVKWSVTGDHYYPIVPPLMDAEKVEEIENYAGWPDPRVSTFAEGKREEAKRLHEETDYAVGGDIWVAGSVFHRYAFLRGFDQWFLDMRLNPDLYRVLADKILEVNTQLLTPYLNEIGDYLDIIYITDDMGGQSGPFMSVEDYKKYVKPWFRRFLNTLRRLLPKAKVLYHTDGSVYQLIPEFIECGIDALNPIQPLAKNMEPERLKREFGDKLCFHGGIDQQMVLPLGTAEEVRAHVKKVLSALAPGGGYIVAPAHQLQGDIPPQNIYTMYRTVLDENF